MQFIFINFMDVVAEFLSDRYGSLREQKNSLHKKCPENCSRSPTQV